MVSAPDDHLPVQLGIRLLLDSVSYTNALPEWFEPLIIDYNAREATIRGLVRHYLNGGKPQTPFQVAVPKRDGKSNIWIVPTINDQVVCQTATSVIADLVQAKAVDAAKVFSCRLNKDPNRVAFLEDQVSAWARFQARMQALCADQTCVLQIDLKDTFDSIAPSKMLTFIDRIGADQKIIELLKALLGAFTTATGGMPFLNDSLFFLGNAYLGKADDIVAKRSPNFIRFLDDYKLFAPSYPSLEAAFGLINSDLKAIGLEINEQKLWLGSGEEYLQAASKLKYGATLQTDYIGAAAQPDVIEPASMLALVKAALQTPGDYLHQGFGRLQMAAIRRMRVRGIYTDVKQYAESPDSQFSAMLEQDADAIRMICQLLDEYSQDDASTWRLVWVLYLCKDIDLAALKDKDLRTRLANILARIEATPTLPAVGRLWAKRMPLYPNIQKSPAEIEELHALNYVDRGRRCYGS